MWRRGGSGIVRGFAFLRPWRRSLSDDRIQFHCGTCGKSLRAPVSRAGAVANCPQCGDPVEVPRPAASPARRPAPQGFADDPAEGGARPAGAGIDGGPRFDGGDAFEDGLMEAGPPDRVVCPVCGTEADPDAAECPACGELLGGFKSTSRGGRLDGPTDVTLGGVTGSAVEDYKQHFGILLGGIALCWLIAIAAVMACYMLMFGLMFGGMAVAGGAGGGGDAAGVVAVVAGVFGAFAFAGAIAALYAWLSLGLAGMHLEAVRSRPELGTLFRGTGFWRMLLCGTIVAVSSYALSLVTMFGFVFLVFGLAGGGGPAGAEIWFVLMMYGSMFAVNGLFFLLFWPLPFLCVDRPDLGHVRPLMRSLTLPQGSWGGHLAVGASAYAILLLSSIFTCGIGVLFAGPLAGLMLAHAYDRLDRGAADGRGGRGLRTAGRA